jgi:hypothetical protein
MLRIIAKLKWRTKLSGENTESFRCRWTEIQNRLVL